MRLERAIDQAIEGLPAEMRAVVAGLQSLRGIKTVSAVTIVAEVGPLSRFPRPKQLMDYSGMVSSEDSTGSSVRRGAITKTGNAHLRRIAGEAAWAYQYRPAMSPEMKKRQEGLSGAESAVHSLPAARGQGEAAAEGHDRHRARDWANWT